MGPRVRGDDTGVVAKAGLILSFPRGLRSKPPTTDDIVES
jgi:hypothetical protein